MASAKQLQHKRTLDGLDDGLDGYNDDSLFDDNGDSSGGGGGGNSGYDPMSGGPGSDGKDTTGGGGGKDSTGGTPTDSAGYGGNPPGQSGDPIWNALNGLGDAVSTLLGPQTGNPINILTGNTGDPFGGLSGNPFGGIGSDPFGDPFGGIVIPTDQTGNQTVGLTAPAQQGPSTGGGLPIGTVGAPASPIDTDFIGPPAPTFPDRNYPLPNFESPTPIYVPTPQPPNLLGGDPFTGPTQNQDQNQGSSVTFSPYSPIVTIPNPKSTTGTTGLLNLQQKLALLRAANAKAATILMNNVLETLSGFAKMAGVQDTTYDTLVDAFNAILTILVILTHTEVEDDLNDINTNTPQGVSDYNNQINGWVNSLNNIIDDMNSLLKELNDGTLLPPPSKSDIQKVINDANGWIFYLKSLRK